MSEIARIVDELQREHSGAAASDPEEGDWPAVADPSDAHDPRAPGGAGVSYYVLLHGIVQHDAYHAGQIAIVKKG